MNLEPEIRTALLHWPNDAEAPPPDAGRVAVAHRALRRRRARRSGGALAVGAALVGGVFMLSNRSTDREDQGRPTAASPDLSAAEADAAKPTAAPVVTNEPAASTASRVAATSPSTNAAGPALRIAEPGSLLSQSIDADEVPLIAIDRPGWTLDYLNGSDSLPLGDLAFRAPREVWTGDGPLFDAPWFSTSIYSGPGVAPEDGDSQAVTIGSAPGSIEIRDTDGDTGLSGPIVTLRWQLPDGRVGRVEATRMSPDDVVRIAAELDLRGDTLSLSAVEDPTSLIGIRSTQPVADAPWATLSVRFRKGDASIEVIGTNRGLDGLVDRIGTEVRTTRVVSGVEVAYRPLPATPNEFWADWMPGGIRAGWSFYAIAEGFSSEEQFLDLLGRLVTVAPEQFAALGSADDPLAQVLLPGDHTAEALAIVDGIPTMGVNVAAAGMLGVPTTQGNLESAIYQGLACGLIDAWLTAGTPDVKNEAAAALRVLQERTSAHPEIGAIGEVLKSVLDAIEAGDQNSELISGFGSNDCPTWARLPSGSGRAAGSKPVAVPGG